MAEDTLPPISEEFKAARLRAMQEFALSEKGRRIPEEHLHWAGYGFAGGYAAGLADGRRIPQRCEHRSCDQTTVYESKHPDGSMLWLCAFHIRFEPGGDLYGK